MTILVLEEGFEKPAGAASPPGRRRAQNMMNTPHSADKQRKAQSQTIDEGLTPSLTGFHAPPGLDRWSSGALALVLSKANQLSFVNHHNKAFASLTEHIHLQSRGW